MRELEYPFDADEIIAKKKKIRRLLKGDDKKRLQLKIAILGGSTTVAIKQILELFLLNYGIEPEFYESDYGRFYQEAMFPNGRLESFVPDIIYICTTNRNVTRYPDMKDSVVEINGLITAELEKYHVMWQKLSEKYHCPVIQNNFEMPYYRLLGNRDAYDIHGAVNFLSRINMEFYQYAQSHDNFYICDLNYISADYGLKKWADPFYWYAYKYPLAVPAIPYLTFNIANIIKSLMGKNKKGIVLDLDNTLWGGVIGDDGVEHIVLGPEDAEGQAYLEFQKYIKAHLQLGILLNIDSKNNREDALAGINHPSSIFEEKDFISIHANWNQKDQNFTAISKELSLLPESLVFIDDNPAERYIVTKQHKGVQAPEISDVSHYIEVIDRSGYFESSSISDDDLRRNTMYQQNAGRANAEAFFTDYGDYLNSLNMKAVIKPFEPVYMARIAQLTNKSNQFNLTTKRYTQAEIEAISSDNRYITLCGRLEDRFGDNGVISLIIGHVMEQQCHVDLWLMSCRVLKREMEHAMLDTLVHACRQRSVRNIVGYFFPTEKNSMVENLYKDLGFSKIADLDKGGTQWNLELTIKYKKRNKYIFMEED